MAKHSKISNKLQDLQSSLTELYERRVHIEDLLDALEYQGLINDQYTSAVEELSILDYDISELEGEYSDDEQALDELDFSSKNRFKKDWEDD